MQRPDVTTFARGVLVAAGILAVSPFSQATAEDDLLARGKIIANRVLSGQIKASDLTGEQHHAMRAYALHLRGIKTTTVPPTAPPEFTPERFAATCRIADPTAPKSRLICDDPALKRVELNCSARRGDDGLQRLGCGSPAFNKIIVACAPRPDAPQLLVCAQ